MNLLGMKNYNYYGCGLLIVALACATLSGCQTSGTGASSTASASTASMPASSSKSVGRLGLDHSWGAYSELTFKHVPMP